MADEKKPLLGDLVREKRAGRYLLEVAREIGVPYGAIRDVERGRGITAQEAENIRRWLAIGSKFHAPISLIKRRQVGRTAAKPDAYLAAKLLAHVAGGGTIKTFKDLDYPMSPDQLQRKVGKWLAADSEFERKYLAAKRAGSYLLMDEVIDIADGLYIDLPDNEGKRKPQPVDIGRAKLMIEMRVRTAALHNPAFASAGGGRAGGSSVTVNFGDTLERLEAQNRRLRLIEPQPPEIVDSSAPVIEGVSDD